MALDLRKLIAKKTYAVPVETSMLLEQVLKRLNADDLWELQRKGSGFASFMINAKRKYALFSLMNEGKERNAVNIAKKEAEFQKKPIHCVQKLLEILLNPVPVEITYLVTEERIGQSIIQASCKPALYFKIGKEIKYEKPDLQDIRLRGEEFLDEIFIGELKSKEIQERKEMSKYELLINDVHVRQISEKVSEMLNGATTCVLLMGWVGTYCLPKFKELKNTGITIRAVTHKPSELKSPVAGDIQKGYSELVDIIGLENVSVNPLLHGRALIVDNKALIGSMDFNSHSLSGQHIEFAVYTEDVEVVRSLRGYFEKMFKPLKEK